MNRKELKGRGHPARRRLMDRLQNNKSKRIKMSSGSFSSFLQIKELSKESFFRVFTIHNPKLCCCCCFRFHCYGPEGRGQVYLKYVPISSPLFASTRDENWRDGGSVWWMLQIPLKTCEDFSNLGQEKGEKASSWSNVSTLDKFFCFLESFWLVCEERGREGRHSIWTRTQ